jgi:hypothetical protein
MVSSSRNPGAGAGASDVRILDGIPSEVSKNPDKRKPDSRPPVPIRPEEWSGQDGARRAGLSCMSWHCGVAEIGRNRAKEERRSEAAEEPHAAAATRSNDFHSDRVRF